MADVFPLAQCPQHWRCRCFGHDVRFFDSGYAVCQRCQAHEYWHYAVYRVVWYRWPFHLLCWTWEKREAYRRWWASGPSLWYMAVHLWRRRNGGPDDGIPF